MIAEGVRRPGRMEREWPTTAPAARPADGRAALLEALAAYRRGIREAPVVCKWGIGTGVAADAEVAVAGLPRRLAPRNDNGFVVRQAHHERVGGHHERVGGHHERVGGHHEREAGGPLVFVASNGEVDRHGDTVAPEGWRLDGYRENPVVLWAHDYRQPAIGRADAVWSDGRAVLARLEFAPTEFRRAGGTIVPAGLPARGVRGVPAHQVRGTAGSGERGVSGHPVSGAGAAGNQRGAGAGQRGRAAGKRRGE